MYSNKVTNNYILGDGIIRFNLLKSGNLKEITDDSNNIRINTYVGNDLEATISNIYLLVNNGNDSYYTLLLGKNSPSKFIYLKDKALYYGSFMGINYQITLKVFDHLFTYSIHLSKTKEHLKIKLFYGLDLSIADIGGVSSNEAYISQYIDHKVFKNDLGFTICSRQNQGRHYYFELGCLNKTVGYSTDGFQFFGKDYKFNYIPIALTKQKLENKIYQYEFAYPALETDFFELKDDADVTFYGGFLKDHDEAITKTHFSDEIINLEKPELVDLTNMTSWKEEKSLISFDCIYPYHKMSEDEIKKFYGNPSEWSFVEKDKELYSFFLNNKAHIVIPEKERLMERPSGNIMVSLQTKDNLLDLEKAYATTTYIYGLFNSQIVYGNTSFNKLLTNQRNPLNLAKSAGQRIFLKINDEYQLLTMPSVYEMGLNYAKWIYKVNDDYLIIENIMSQDQAKSTLYFKSLNNIDYDILVTNQVVLKQTEDDEAISYQVHDNLIRFDFDQNTNPLTKAKYPNYYFLMKTDYDDFFIVENNLFVFKYHTSNFNINILGSDNTNPDLTLVQEAEKTKYLNRFDELLNHLKIETTNKYLDSYNYLSYWFLHDALIHYLSPHGLEQYNGAAWGTRDVSQGPFELFSILNELDEVRRIIKVVFAHQFLDTYTFPQWFMFDKFTNICDTSSHGDVILWPLRMVGMYLKQTNDYDILNLHIPYLDRTIMDFQGSDNLLNHLKKAISSIEANFIEGTYLSSYGGGDWDDTLQPAKKEYKNKMVSGWTVELTYEVFNLLAEVLDDIDSDYSNHLRYLSSKMKEDFYRYLMIDGIPAGFIYFDNAKVTPIIHPSDKRTNINYRLLPLSRGGISKMFSSEETQKAVELIDTHLLHPDGVRLMDKPIKYQGGINTYFQRAETCSNFGREIGMQYCHAHIRYCEFLYKLDLSEKYNKEILKINPIIIQDVVKNAMARQRNSYFSSSDAYFYNRYEVANHFDDLKQGKVLVKGGWRVYSSGPGIYLHNFIEGLLGIEIINNRLTLKPHVIDDNLKIQFRILNKLVTIIYHQEKKQKKILINGKIPSFEVINQRIIIHDELKEGDIIDLYC